jgi:hypothetical protein
MEFYQRSVGWSDLPSNYLDHLSLLSRDKGNKVHTSLLVLSCPTVTSSPYHMELGRSRKCAKANASKHSSRQPKENLYLYTVRLLLCDQAGDEPSSDANTLSSCAFHCRRLIEGNGIASSLG